MFSLFDCLGAEVHHVVMENIYKFVKVAKDFYRHPKKVLVHVVVRRWGGAMKQEQIMKKNTVSGKRYCQGECF